MKIGNVELENPYILAPMAGVTDLPFRLLCKEQGAGLLCMEMISAKALQYKNKNTKALLAIHPEENPVSLQLFGSEPNIISEMAKQIEELPFQILDINMGCPVPKVVRNGEGSALMKEPKLVSRRVQPVGIMFSEYYFYLTAFLEKRNTFENPDDLFPTIYRIDRIKNLQVLDEHFQLPYRDRFEEGEFRKRVQFMYGGKLQTIRFRYTGPSIEAVLDRLPTAKIIAQDEGGWTISAEVFGKGIDMWLKSQGDYIKDVNAV